MLLQPTGLMYLGGIYQSYEFARHCCFMRMQIVNFARVPLRHQLVVMNGGTILDSAFLCW